MATCFLSDVAMMITAAARVVKASAVQPAASCPSCSNSSGGIGASSS